MPALRDFKNDFSRSAFTVLEGEAAIVGKFGRIIQLDDGAFDYWFVGPNLAPLSGRRIAIIRRNLPQGGTLNALNGEGWIRGRGRRFVLTCAHLMGIRRKKRVSAATIQRLTHLSQREARTC